VGLFSSIASANTFLRDARPACPDFLMNIRAPCVRPSINLSSTLAAAANVGLLGTLETLELSLAFLPQYQRSHFLLSCGRSLSSRGPDAQKKAKPALTETRSSHKGFGGPGVRRCETHWTQKG
jgi:hypothetical protein